ncbi:hypothetical protein AQUCO_02600197v1 [Aquilegia coerulea]|uniref:Uncharacterized protein n=1 Tax=Aquilegia coerulea TaxID=218851 RepID=A0A2G5D7S5_AQUCA|nr:hypothetical protein AQUCO_02600197v1 [Aquilegia coerulea]
MHYLGLLSSDRSMPSFGEGTFIFFQDCLPSPFSFSSICGAEVAPQPFFLDASRWTRTLSALYIGVTLLSVQDFLILLSKGSVYCSTDIDKRIAVLISSSKLMAVEASAKA